MSRKHRYNEDYNDYDYEDDYDNHRSPRKFKKDHDTASEKKKHWDRENHYADANDYDDSERR